MRIKQFWEVLAVWHMPVLEGRKREMGNGCADVTSQLLDVTLMVWGLRGVNCTGGKRFPLVRRVGTLRTRWEAQLRRGPAPRASCVCPTREAGPPFPFTLC